MSGLQKIAGGSGPLDIEPSSATCGTRSADGNGVSNQRASLLLKILKAEQDVPS